MNGGDIDNILRSLATLNANQQLRHRRELDVLVEIKYLLKENNEIRRKANQGKLPSRGFRDRLKVCFNVLWG